MLQRRIKQQRNGKCLGTNFQNPPMWIPKTLDAKLPLKGNYVIPWLS